jgi:predicted nucleic acid-binding protein
MKVLVDTSVLVASVLDQHDCHEVAFAVLDRVQKGTDAGFISAHTMAEMYAVLTRLPPPFRHSPEQALFSIEENVVKYFKITGLTGHDYKDLLREAALMGIQGGTIYDAVVLKSAVKSEVARIYTLNQRHFRAVAAQHLRSRIYSA